MIAYFTSNITFVNVQYNVTVMKTNGRFCSGIFFNKLLFLLHQIILDIWTLL